MATITMNGMEYRLAGNLRVAYNLQKQYNHEAYSSILSRVGEMTLEQQLDVLYAAFQVANPEEAKTISSLVFREYILDHDEFNASVILDMIKDVISGILGRSLDSIAQDEAVSAKN